MNSLQIANSALLRVGQRPLQSLDEDSADSRLISILIEPAIEEVLRESVWSSALKRAKLVKLPTAPLFEYSVQYALPADMIRLVNIYDKDGVADRSIYWRIEGNYLLSDAEDLNIVYIHVPEDIDTLDSLLGQVISLKLAMKLAYPKTESKTLVDSILVEYETLMLQKAKSIDSIENNTDSGFAEINWLTSRNFN